MIEVENSKRKIRIVSGRPLEVETQVNLMLEEYAPMSWTVTVVGDHVELTCLLVLESEVRKAQLAQIQPMQMRRA